MKPPDPAAAIARLLRQVADAEAVLGDLRAKLARAEAKASGQPAAITGLDLLWKAALPKARERSSQHRCRVAWSRLPKHERPAVAVALAALAAWNRCEAWKCDASQFCPGLHRFISDRMWEDLPESADPMARYHAPPKAPPPATAPEDALTPDEVARFLSLKKIRP